MDGVLVHSDRYNRRSNFRVKNKERGEIKGKEEDKRRGKLEEHFYRASVPLLSKKSFKVARVTQQGWPTPPPSPPPLGGPAAWRFGGGGVAGFSETGGGFVGGFGSAAARGAPEIFRFGTMDQLHQHHVAGGRSTMDGVPGGGGGGGDSAGRVSGLGPEGEQGLPPGYRQGDGIPPEVPSSPPPSYEQVLAENRLAAEAAQMQRDAEGAAEALGACAVPEKEKKEEKKERREKKEKAKSSKEQYRQLAAQWGITCKMSDKCRCLECQSRYFDCEYEQNEQEKTDGGLGAGTPMFISEVMGGTACRLL